MLGDLFVKFGELFNIIIEFLANLFSGTSGNNALDQIK